MSVYDTLICLDENNVFIIQKLLYYFEINTVYTQLSIISDNLSDPKYKYILHGIVDVRGKKIVFLIPTYPFKFPFGDHMLGFSYKQIQQSKVDRGNIMRMDHIILSGPNIDILNNFLYEVEKLEFIMPDNKLIKYVWKESYWKFCNGFKRRPLDTLYLPEKYKSFVIDEIKNFYNSDKTFYENMSIPQRKVFLFWGIPGTGKTTFIRAIASHFNKHIAIVKNTHDIDDASLENMLEELPSNSIILFEDIDSLFQGRDNIANTHLTFSGLLNFLDGIIDYDKLLIFITTNNLKDIDNALRRRIDTFLEFTYIKKIELKLMFNKFFNGRYSVDEFLKKINKEVTPNSLEKYFTKCLCRKISPIDDIASLYSYVDLTKIPDNDMYV